MHKMNNRFWNGPLTLILKNCVKKLRQYHQNQSGSKRFGEWGINLSLRKRVGSYFPKGFLWKLTFMNIVIIAGSIALSSWALYHTACFLVEGIGHFGEQKQLQFNATLSHYLWVFSMIGLVAGSMMSFYITKRQIQPIRDLIQSTKRLKQGEYPDPIDIQYKDEVDRKSTRLNSSHVAISYAVFCLKNQIKT